MSNELLSKMREEVTSKNPLKQQILLKKSNYEKIFIFEGVDDYPVYDEWMKRNDVYQKSGHLIARGKRQVIELYEHALNVNDVEILTSCLFFVDHDYDNYEHNSDAITTLSCYSIENYIVNKNSTKNYLMDEFKMDITESDLRDEVISVFMTDLNKFNELAKNICEPLFVNYNLLGKTKFYEKISSVMSIQYSQVRLKDGADLIGFQVDEFSVEAVNLKQIFSDLPYERSIKGKYVFEFIKLWLSSLKSHLINKRQARITKDPLMLERRRLACSSPVPFEIAKFS
ncbi:TPA: DUF4435 domain-containing protein [Yersinia enterocolitica]|uniref:DUF4435 domain-containing protein n=1 Tax=Yersinia mollaretii TaxID=33060 RepID=UPI0011A1D2AD|nr:DUF4435 domain-containing protein [Yersinia mollaretii]ELI8051012.1 DUF4435 domain-containing protein [Yersinia enterocolitica]HDL7102887.1 DUF4435 domain-containing protein [Yersinia enterocolitica]HDL7173111.1 DUF4435 domain-containing protein [Yersinia enterocolitica]